MPRSISWQPRLPDMHRLVSESPRTPYTRDDLEKLFRVKTEAAKKLLQLMPRTAQANSAVVEREDLIDFLNQCMDAEDLRAHLDAIRKSPPKPRRRNLRAYVARDFNPGKPLPHPADLQLSRNEARLLFGTFDDFIVKIRALLHLAEHPDFELRYCTPLDPTPQQRAASAETQRIRMENKYLVKVHAARSATDAGQSEIARLLLKEAAELSAQLRRLMQDAGLPGDDDHLMRADEMLAALFPARVDRTTLQM